MNTRSAFVAIVGLPNVGKSSLLNAFVGEKVAIVTAKPQTTRTRITGILNRDENQIVFIDTPGMHRPKTRLSDYMVRQVRESVADVDVAVLVTEPTGKIQPSERDLMESFRERKIPAILAVNKIDTLARREMMLEKIGLFSEAFPFEEIIPISVHANDGLDLLLKKIEAYAVEGPHYFDDESYTDQPERVLIAEMIREKLLENLRDELPHGVAVEIESMKDRPDGGLMDLSAVIYCEKKSHKGMIIGKQGAMLKKIGSQARADIEKFLDCRVNLQCWVRIKDDWRNREGLIRQLGFH